MDAIKFRDEFTEQLPMFEIGSVISGWESGPKLEVHHKFYGFEFEVPIQENIDDTIKIVKRMYLNRLKEKSKYIEMEKRELEKEILELEKQIK